MTNPLEGRKPQIDYPCTWSYRVIGMDEARMRAAVLEIVGAAEHTLTLERESSAGKYRALQLDLLVRDEAHRLLTFERLAKHPEIRFVL